MKALNALYALYAKYANVFVEKRTLVKAKSEIWNDNSADGVNFTIRKVNLMFIFIVVVWIFFLNKYMIQNPVFFCV